MKKILTLLLLLSSIPLFSQELENKLLGKWTMFQVEKEGRDVTAEHNPKENRYFIFKSDGTFKSDGDPYGVNTGRFFVNNLNQTLYIDSDQGPDDDSMWKVELKGNLLIWQGFGTEWADSFKLIHKKSE